MKIQLFMMTILMLSGLPVMAAIFPVPVQIELTETLTTPFAALAIEGGSLPPDSGLPMAGGFPVRVIRKNMPVEEAYHLDIRANEVIIEAETERGTMYALTTLQQLLRPQNGLWVLPLGTVTDQPANQERGVMISLRGCTASAGAVANFKQILVMLAKLKFNTIYLDLSEFAQIYQSELLQFPGMTGIAFSTEQVREILDYAKAWNLRVVPMAQMVSHGTWILNNHSNQALLENPSDTSWNTVWCWRNPQTKAFAEAFLAETVDFFEAKEFHIMLDEILYGPFGVCARCKDTPREQLMAEIITDIHDFLQARGVRTVLFHDAFLTGEATFLETDPQPNNLTLNMPKDMLVNPWYYGDYMPLINKQYNYYDSCSYELLGASFLYPSNIEVFSQRYRNQAGCMATYWFAMSPLGWIDFDDFNTSGMGITAWSAGYYWNPDVKLHGAVEFNPVYTVAQHLYGPSPTFANPVAVSLPVNRSMPTQWPGQVRQQNLPTLPTTFDTVVGTIPYTGAVVVSGRDGDQLPTSVSIPIQRSASKVAFMHTSGVPSNNSQLYAHGGFTQEPELGSYRVFYADGTSETIPLRFRREIVDWNSRLDAARERRGFHGMGDNRLNFRLGILTWENPFPAKEIDRIELHSLQAFATPIACTGLVVDEIQANQGE